MREYIAALAPGSYVVFSHFLDPDVPDLTEVAKRIEQILVQGPLGAGRFRTATEIEAVLPGSGDPATEPGKRAVGGHSLVE